MHWFLLLLLAQFAAAQQLPTETLETYAQVLQSPDNFTFMEFRDLILYGENVTLSSLNQTTAAAGGGSGACNVSSPAVLAHNARCNSPVNVCPFALNEYSNQTDEVCFGDKTYHAGCTAGFYQWKDVDMAAASTYVNNSIADTVDSTAPCCAGYLCPSRLLCQIACPKGSYCGSSSSPAAPPAPATQATSFLSAISDVTSSADAIDFALLSFILLATEYEEVLQCAPPASSFLFCAAGYFCPSAASQETCPSTSYCPIGSVDPIECKAFSSCSGNGRRWEPPNYAPLFTLAVAFIFLILLSITISWALARLHSRQRHRQGGARQRANANAEPPIKMDEELMRAKRKIYYELIPSHSELLAGGVGNADVSSALLKCPFCEYSCRDERAKALRQQEQTLEEQAREQIAAVKGSVFNNDARRLIRRFSVYFKDLSLTTLGSKKSRKVILKPCCGELRSGRLIAIMGSSGSGKSTFLSALTGRAKSYAQIHGKTYLKLDDGEYMPGTFSLVKNFVGYAPQSDIMNRELTVAQNIEYQAKFRFSSVADIGAHVTHIIDSLNLSHARDAIVGDERKRGVSGGELKRVNIALELAAVPSVCAFDEPTSGLDSFGSQAVMFNLRSVATEGAMVMAVIHQPRVEIFSLFQDLVLLARGGRLVYIGEREKALTYFAAHFKRFPPPGVVNPADFLSDLLSNASEQELQLYANTWSEHAHVHAVSVNDTVSFAKTHRSDMPNAWMVFKAVVVRELQLLYARRYSELGFMLVFVVTGVVVALALPLDRGDAVSNAKAMIEGTMIQSLVLGLAGALRATRMFGAELVVLYRDSQAGINRGAVWLGKLLVDLLPLFFFAICQLCGFYGFARVASDSFGSLLLIFYAAIWAASGYGLTLSLIVTDAKKISMVTAVFIAVMVLLAGMMPAYWELVDLLGGSERLVRALTSISYVRHFLRAVISVQFSQSSDALQLLLFPKVAYQLGLHKSLAGGVASPFLDLLLIGLVCRILTLLFLLFTHRAQQNRLSLWELCKKLVGRSFSSSSSARASSSVLDDAAAEHSIHRSKRSSLAPHHSSSKRASRELEAITSFESISRRPTSSESRRSRSASKVSHQRRRTSSNAVGHSNKQ